PRSVPALHIPQSPNETRAATRTAAESSARADDLAPRRSRDGHTGTRTGQESLPPMSHARERHRCDVLLLRVQVSGRSEAATVRISRTGKASHNTLPKRNDASPPVPCIPGPTARDFPLLVHRNRTSSVVRIANTAVRTIRTTVSHRSRRVSEIRAYWNHRAFGSD